MPPPDTRDAFKIMRRHEAILNPKMENYLRERGRWFNRSRTCDAYQSLSEQWNNGGYARNGFRLDDAIADESVFRHAIKCMSDKSADTRERQHREWSNSIEVQNFKRAESDMSKLMERIRTTGDTDLLAVAQQSPARAIADMKMSDARRAELDQKNDTGDLDVAPISHASRHVMLRQHEDLSH